ncbi:hypothetical protein Tco_1037749, partial [Tanacetum coccineum]
SCASYADRINTEVKTSSIFNNTKGVRAELVLRGLGYAWAILSSNLVKD